MKGVEEAREVGRSSDAPANLGTESLKDAQQLAMEGDRGLRNLAMGGLESEPHHEPGGRQQEAVGFLHGRLAGGLVLGRVELGLLHAVEARVRLRLVGPGGVVLVLRVDAVLVVGIVGRSRALHSMYNVG